MDSVVGGGSECEGEEMGEEKWEQETWAGSTHPELLESGVKASERRSEWSALRLAVMEAAELGAVRLSVLDGVVKAKAPALTRQSASRRERPSRGSRGRFARLQEPVRD
jgi:hypothetical protein